MANERGDRQESVECTAGLLHALLLRIGEGHAKPHCLRRLAQQLEWGMQLHEVCHVVTAHLGYHLNALSMELGLKASSLLCILNGGTVLSLAIVESRRDVLNLLVLG